MTSTDFNRNEIEAPAEPGSIGAGAEIYRRMERRGKRRPMWMTAAPIVALAVVAAGGVVAYEAMKPNTAPKPPVQAAQSTPPAAPAQVAATPPTPAPAPAVAPTHAAPVRVVHEVKIEHVRPALTPVAHQRTARAAHAAAAAGEDTSAYAPGPQPVVRPAPAPAASSPAAPTQSVAPAPTVTAPPVAVTPAPAPVTASPPPASSAAPADSSQTTPAPQ
jgi:hypothetical protein